MSDSASLPWQNGLPHPDLLAAMRDAATLIETVKARGIIARDKADSSPVTEADEGAEKLLEAAIRALEPDAVIVGEEAVEAGRIPAIAPRFWLIDPLDGTRDFVAGRLGYTVNVGLVADGAPVLGLVLHPPTGRLWVGAPGRGSFRLEADGRRTAIAARPLQTPPDLLVSHSHPDPRTQFWVDAIPGAQFKGVGSSIKLCLLAQGEADAYPRYGPTMEWDTAAGDAILRAAGGITIDQQRVPFAYGKTGYRNTAFLALADPAATHILPVL